MGTELLQTGIEVACAGVHAEEWGGGGPLLEVISPIDGERLAAVRTATAEEVDHAIAAAQRAFVHWRTVPAPQRGEIVRQLGEALRAQREELALLVTREMGKTLVEARGEVQEMIDICDFAVGLARQIGGRTLPSERAGHRLVEQYHPLGVVAVVTAFNFPVAVWAWNAALALVCGDAVLWKPSSKTPLSAIACTRLAAEVLQRNGQPTALASLVVGRGAEIGDRLIRSPDVALVSYTGSVATGRRVGVAVQQRFGRSILELGGNAALILGEHGNLELALRSVFFGALGTSGQRCTTTRRVLLPESRYDEFVGRLRQGYAQVTIGDPRQEVLMGPLVDRAAIATMQAALEQARAEGATVLSGGEPLPLPGGCYVTPALVEARPEMAVVQEETFAPILYLLRYRTFDEAIALQNGVRQGLSSALFTEDLREAELFLSAVGSDCGLANVNAGTSGAEIGGAFGGGKETGGGREAGSDAWKGYMRRQTSVINASGALPLAQGVRFTL